MSHDLGNMRKSDFTAMWDQGYKAPSGKSERQRFDKFRAKAHDEYHAPETVSVRRGSVPHQSGEEKDDSGPKYSESIHDKRERTRASARKAILAHVKQWKEQQSQQSEQKEEKHMDDSERMQKREELLKEIHKAEDEAMFGVRDPLTAQAYARENATTGDDGSIRSEDRRSKRYASKWSVRGSGVNQQWNLMERSLHPRTFEQEAKFAGQPLDREKSDAKKDTDFDADNIPEGKAQRPAQEQQIGGKVGA